MYGVKISYYSKNRAFMHKSRLLFRNWFIVMYLLIITKRKFSTKETAKFW